MPLPEPLVFSYYVEGRVEGCMRDYVAFVRCYLCAKDHSGAVKLATQAAARCEGCESQHPCFARPADRGARWCRSCSGAHEGAVRARSHCRFVLPLIHFIPDSLIYSVPLFLKRQCDRTLGAVQRRNDLSCVACGAKRASVALAVHTRAVPV